jgi:hypothetical protein
VNGQIGGVLKPGKGIKQFALSAVFALIDAVQVQAQPAWGMAD